MVKFARLVLAAVLTMVGLGALGQEIVVFTDSRSLQVQSHRVDGTWTYLRIASGGEMAVPSASILRVENERGVSPAASVPAQTNAVPPSAAAPPPASNGPEAVRRPNLPPPPVAVDPEDEEDSEDVEEMDEPEPEEPPAKPPDVQPQTPGSQPQHPGLPQTPTGMPPRPGVFQQPQQPGATPPQKPVEDD